MKACRKVHSAVSFTSVAVSPGSAALVSKRSSVWRRNPPSALLPCLQTSVPGAFVHPSDVMASLMRLPRSLMLWALTPISPNFARTSRLAFAEFLLSEGIKLTGDLQLADGGERVRVASNWRALSVAAIWPVGRSRLLTGW